MATHVAEPFNDSWVQTYRDCKKPSESWCHPSNNHKVWRWYIKLIIIGCVKKEGVLMQLLKVDVSLFLPKIWNLNGSNSSTFHIQYSTLEVDDFDHLATPINSVQSIQSEISLYPSAKGTLGLLQSAHTYDKKIKHAVVTRRISGIINPLHESPYVYAEKVWNWDGCRLC